MALKKPSDLLHIDENELSSFFKLVSEEKIKKKREYNDLVGHTDLSNVFEELSN